MLEKFDQNIFMVIGMALITILIPVEIVIFEKKRDYDTLDKNVILEYIIRVKYSCVVRSPDLTTILFNIRYAIKEQNLN